MTARLSRGSVLFVAAIAAALNGCGGSSGKLDGAVDVTSLIEGGGAGGAGGGAGQDAAGADSATSSQHFNVAWTIEDNATGAPLTCTQVGAARVDLHVDAMTFSFTCSAGQGMTGNIQPGSYALSATLLDAQGTSLSETGTMTRALSPNVSVTLPTITFAVL